MITIPCVPVLARAVICTWCVDAVGVGVTRVGFTFVGVCNNNNNNFLFHAHKFTIANIVSKQNSFLLDNIRKYNLFALLINLHMVTQCLLTSVEIIRMTFWSVWSWMCVPSFREKVDKWNLTAFNICPTLMVLQLLLLTSVGTAY